MIAGSILLFSMGNTIIYPLIIIAIAVSFIPAPVFSFPSKLLKPEHLGLAFGILVMVSNSSHNNLIINKLLDVLKIS